MTGPPIHLEDRKLVKQLLAGNESAFSRFFDENFSRLFRFVIPRVSQDQELAQEVVQSALSKALMRIESFRGESALFTWLCMIARNELADRIKSNSRYRQHIVLTEDFPHIRAAVDSLTMSAANEPGRRYQQHEMARLIQVALDQLPPRYGDALEWKYIQGHSVKEIGRRLGVSQEAAQSLLARARRAFQEVYSEFAGPLIEEART